MEFNNENLTDIINKIVEYEQFKLSDIPDIPLYMDQVTTFIESKLSYLKRNEEDNALTKTMINNYTKAKILMPPEKKKYNREHIILIILIYHFKHILSLDDIEKLFKPMLLKSFDKLDLECMYTKFLEIEKSETSSFNGEFMKKVELIKSSGIDSKEDKKLDIILTVAMLLIEANERKRLAESIIDEFLKEDSIPEVKEAKSKIKKSN